MAMVGLATVCAPNSNRPVQIEPPPVDVMGHRPCTITEHELQGGSEDVDGGAVADGSWSTYLRADYVRPCFFENRLTVAVTAHFADGTKHSLGKRDLRLTPHPTANRCVELSFEEIDDIAGATTLQFDYSATLLDGCSLALKTTNCDLSQGSANWCSGGSR
jgi:hypothetical protein